MMRRLLDVLRRMPLVESGGSWATGGILALAAIVAVAVAAQQSAGSGLDRASEGLAELAQASAFALGFAAAVGVAAAGLVEFIKRTFRLRGVFQRWEVQRFLLRLEVRNRLRSYGPAGEEPSFRDFHWNDSAFVELTSYLTGGGLKGEVPVFDAPLARVMGQIASIANALLERPRESALLRGLLSNPYELRGVRQGDKQSAQGLLHRLEELMAESPIGPSDIGRRELAAVLGEAKSRVERNLDALQFVVGQGWQYRVRIAGAGVAGLVGIAATSFTDASAWAEVFGVVLAVSLGGAFSWLARDLAYLAEKGRE